MGIGTLCRTAILCMGARVAGRSASCHGCTHCRSVCVRTGPGAAVQAHAVPEYLRGSLRVIRKIIDDAYRYTSPRSTTRPAPPPGCGAAASRSRSGAGGWQAIGCATRARRPHPPHRVARARRGPPGATASRDGMEDVYSHGAGGEGNAPSRRVCVGAWCATSAPP